MGQIAKPINGLELEEKIKQNILQLVGCWTEMWFLNLEFVNLDTPKYLRTKN